MARIWQLFRNNVPSRTNKIEKEWSRSIQVIKKEVCRLAGAPVKLLVLLSERLHLWPGLSYLQLINCLQSALGKEVEARMNRVR